jgi:DNA polymerase elongation subunit (family B)
MVLRVYSGAFKHRIVRPFQPSIYPSLPYCHRSLTRTRYQSGIIMVSGTNWSARLPPEIRIDEADSELDLINRLTDIVREYDPDILTGYEVHSSSWGYVVERARVHFGNLHSSSN